MKKYLVVFIVIMFNFNEAKAQCGIGFAVDTIPFGMVDVNADFSGLTDPAKGSVLFEAYDMYGNLMDYMVLNNSFNWYQSLSFMQNMNYTYRSIYTDTLSACVDTTYGELTMLSQNTNFYCDPHFVYTHDSLNMTFDFEANKYNPPSTLFNWIFEWNINGSGNPATHTFSTNVVTDYLVKLYVSGPDCYHPNENIEDTITAGYVPECEADFDLFEDSLNGAVYYAWNYSFGSSITYLWDFGDGATSTDAYPTHIYNSLGMFEICLTIFDTSGCQSTFCDSIDVVYKTPGTTLNILDPNNTNLELSEFSSSGLSIYPNPTSGQFVMEYENNSTEALKFIVHNLNGSVVHQQILPAIIGKNIYQIDMNHLESGLYIYRINGVKGKLMIE